MRHRRRKRDRAAAQGPILRGPKVATPDSAQAWLIVGSAFCASFVAFGIIYSFGVFLRPIAVAFHADAAAGSAFFSITAVVYYGLGAFAGRLADRFGPRVVVASGAVILGLGLCLTAATGRLWLAYLVYGLGVGIGGACCYVPTLSLVGGWFVRHRNAALGIAAAGTGTGTMAVPPLAADLIERCGWRMTDIILGLAATAVLLGCAAVARASPLAQTPEKSARRARMLFGSRAFVLLYVSWVLGTTALFVPLVFLPGFARDHGAGAVAAAGLISLIGGASILGRIVLGPLGNRLGVVPLFKLAVLLMALSYALWLFSSSYIWLVLFAVVLGVAYGSRIAAVPAVLIEYFGVENLGTTLGVFFTATGLAALIGPPLAGIAAELGGAHRGAVLFALATGLLGFVAIAPLRARSAGAP
ncbi:MAG: MFS transporter [Stellaceae bacterium]